MGAEPVVIDEEARAAVHACVTLGLAGIVSSVVECVNALDACGVEEATRLVSRLLSDAAAWAIDEGEVALGAPFATADSTCVREHALALANRNERAHGAYVSRVREVVDLLAQRKKINEAAADAMRTALLESAE